MKLSEVSRAKDLVDARRKLAVAYVEVGLKSEVYDPYWSSRKATVFGCEVDDPMREALRRATRQEILRRVGEYDAELSTLGAEVDGIEIKIRREESLRHPAEVAA